MSDDPRYVPRLDLVLYDEDESERLRQSHHMWSLQAPCYDSDDNMVRDSVRCIKRVDSDGETVATDDTRVLQTYNSDWSVYSGDMRDTPGTDEAPVVSPRPSTIRALAAPPASNERFPFNTVIRVLPYDASVFSDPKVKIPDRYLDRITAAFSHTWVIVPSTKHPNDQLVGHIGLAINYDGNCVELGLATGDEVIRKFARLRPVVPKWSGCARCHRLCIVIDESSSWWCYVGSVQETSSSETTLGFDDGSRVSFPLTSVASANEGWWLSVQGPPERSFFMKQFLQAPSPETARPFAYRPFACGHCDGSSTPRPSTSGTSR